MPLTGFEPMYDLRQADLKSAAFDRSAKVAGNYPELFSFENLSGSQVLCTTHAVYTCGRSHFTTFTIYTCLVYKLFGVLIRNTYILLVYI